MLRSDDKARSSLSSVLEKEINIALPGAIPNFVKLGAVAKVQKKRSLENIKRVDGRKIIQVTADIDSAFTSAGEVLDKIFSDITPKIKEQFPNVFISIEGDSKRRSNDLKVLLKNMFIALLVIFLMIASQLRSYAKPLIILLTVPIGLAGAIYAHLLFGHNLSFISLFGMVALTGVVINDSIVLVDYYNKMRDRGLEAYDAIIESLRRRFRPILLTTLTTSLGLLPMLFETSLQAQFIIPMAISLAGGIVFASSILIFFFLLFNGFRGSIKKLEVKS